MPLLLMPDTSRTIASVLSGGLAIEPMADLTAGSGVEASDFRVAQGVAVVPVLGELVNRGAWIGAVSGLTSYEGLEAQLRAAASDPAVRGIILDMHSRAARPPVPWSTPSPPERPSWPS